MSRINRAAQPTKLTHADYERMRAAVERGERMRAAARARERIARLIIFCGFLALSICIFYGVTN